MGARSDDEQPSLPPLLAGQQVVDEEIPARPPERRSKEERQLSVAVKKTGGDMPKVVAKGSGALAEQILQVAFAQGVKVRTDADLAEILSTVDVESEVPLEALAAVATILNYVYREQKRPAPDL